MKYRKPVGWIKSGNKYVPIYSRDQWEALQEAARGKAGSPPTKPSPRRPPGHKHKSHGGTREA